MSAGSTRSRDWPLVAVSALFTAGGLWMAASGVGADRRSGIGVAVFFGACTVVGLWLRATRRAYRKSAEARRVEIVGSVPIRLRTGRGVALLVAVAVVLAISGWAMPGLARGVTLAGALLCAALLPVLLLGPLRRRALVFEPEGLRLVEVAWELVVPWDAIAAARLVDVEGTLVAALNLRAPERLVAAPLGRGASAVDAQRRLARAVALNRSIYGCDLCTAPSAFGLDPVLFLRAVETYVADAGARRGLAPRPALDAAP